MIHAVLTNVIAFAWFGNAYTILRTCQVKGVAVRIDHGGANEAPSYVTNIVPLPNSQDPVSQTSTVLLTITERLKYNFSYLTSELKWVDLAEAPLIASNKNTD